MTADSDAFAAAQKLGIPPVEQQYLVSVARGEGRYGLAWATPSASTIAKSEEMGVDPRAGANSFNWGAVQGSGPAGSFPHIDTRSDGTFYIGNYRRYNTSAEGAADMARILLKPNLKEALRTGNYPGPPPLRAGANAQQKKFHAAKVASIGKIGPLKAAVFTQHDNGYYELDPEKYLNAVRLNYTKLTQALKWPLLLDPPAKVEMIAKAPLVGSCLSRLLARSFGER